MRNVWLPSNLFHDPKFSSLSDQAKLLFMYLYVNPHSNLAGAFYLPEGYIRNDIDRSVAQLEKPIAELEGKGLVRYCKRTSWVWLNRHLDYEPIRGEKQIAGFAKLARYIPETCSFYEDFKRNFDENAWQKRRNNALS